MRFGFLGVAAFVLLALSGSYTKTWFREAVPQNAFFPAVCGSFTSFALVLMTVWLCHDFGF